MTEVDVNGCGMVGCFGGWAALLAGYKNLGDLGAERGTLGPYAMQVFVREWFDLTAAEEDRLTWVGNTLYDLQRIVDEHTAESSTRPQWAKDRLRATMDLVLRADAAGRWFQDVWLEEVEDEWLDEFHREQRGEVDEDELAGYDEDEPEDRLADAGSF